MNAEGEVCYVAAAMKGKLQWGPIPTNAEGADRPRSASGFNGAAFLRTRNEGSCKCCSHNHCVASMGPRSYERGKPSSEAGPSSRTSAFNGAA
jgi:hypothetical protein